jgi:hypothetical protein
MRRFRWFLGFLGLVALTSACGGDEADHVTADGALDAAADAEVRGEATDASPEAADVAPGDATPDAPEGETDVRPYDYPDAAFVHTEKAPPVTGATAPWSTDEPTAWYRTPDRLPDPGVTSLSLAGGRVWVGTASGLFVHHEDLDVFVAVALPGGGGGVTAVASTLDAGGRLVVVTPERLDFLDPVNGGGESLAFPGGTLTAAAVDHDDVWVGSDRGLWHVEGAFLVAVEPTAELAVRSVVAEGVAWMATDLGLKGWNGVGLLTVAASDGALLDDDVRGVALEGDRLWVATAKGLAVWGPEGQGRTFPAGVGGLPSDDLRAVAALEGQVAFSHGRGATRLGVTGSFDAEVTNTDHYVSQRWLPTDTVTAVALSPAGALWVGTTGGLVRIEDREHTFAEKEAVLDAKARADFWRMDGFVAEEIYSDDAWNPTTWSVGDFDNDGLWTQMQIGAWCYAYAVTKDEKYYQAARKALDVMFLEIDVPAVDFVAAGLGRGFVARSLARDDEGAVYLSKTTDPRWHPVDYQGHTYYWKDDTSSDEVDGHFFGYPLFYDLCAKTDAERAEVADHAVALARFIAENGFVLLDVDGEPTYFGHWEPAIVGVAADGLDACKKNAKLADDPIEAISLCFDAWGGGGWLNSMQILGTMLAAWHMSGDPYFYDQYERLIREFNYDFVATPHAQTFTITNPAIMNHSDHELAMLAYHTLIRYEPNDDRRLTWLQGLLFFYDYEKVERNPLWAAFVSVLAGAQVAENDLALQSLREIPFDRRAWPIDNTHRNDADPWPNDRHDNPQVDRVFPYDEIKTTWWNTNFHATADGGDGRVLVGPVAWTLPYWIFRYAGVIGP